MAEAAGIAIGVVSLAGLFSSCVQVFDLLEMKRTKSLDIAILHQRLQNQKMRFVVWGKSLNLHNGETRYQANSADLGVLDRQVIELTRQTMLLLKAIFEDAETLETRYGLQRVGQVSQVMQIDDSNEDSFRGTLKRIRSKVQRNISIERRHGSSSNSHRWVITDRRQFQELIVNVEGLINELEVLTPSSILVDSRQRRVEEAVNGMPANDLEMVVEAGSPRAGDIFVNAAQHRLEQLSLSYSRRQSEETPFTSASEGRFKFQAFAPNEKPEDMLGNVVTSNKRKSQLLPRQAVRHEANGIQSQLSHNANGIPQRTISVIGSRHHDAEGGRGLLDFAANDDEHRLLDNLLQKNVDVNLRRSNDLKSALLVAVEAGAEFNACRLAKHPQVDVNIFDQSGMTALMYTAVNGNESIAKALTARAEIDHTLRNGDNMTALELAVLRDDDIASVILPVKPTEEVILLDLSPLQLVLWIAIENGWQLVTTKLARYANYACGSHSSNMLTLAVDHGHTQVVEALVQLESVHFNINPLSEREPFFMAVSSGHHRMVQAFICNRHRNPALSDPGQRNLCSPLFEAVRKGFDAIVRELINCAEYNVKHYNDDGESTLDLAIRIGHESIALLLVRDCPVLVSPRALLAVVERGWTRVVHEMMLQSTVDVSATDALGRNALLKATDLGRFDMALVLAQAKPELIHAKDNNGRTLLLAMVEHDNSEQDDDAPKKLVKLALKWKNIDIDAKGYKGRSILLWAIRNNSFELTKLILDARPDSVDTVDERLLTPLHLAVDYGSVDLVRLVTKRAPAAVNAHDARSDTPFHAAVNRDRLDIMQELLELPQINLLERGNKDLTALHIAVFKQHEDMAALLVRCKPELVLCEARNITPLMNAALLPNRHIVELIAKVHTSEQRKLIEDITVRMRRETNDTKRRATSAALACL